ncbi:MAG: hypothetical protein JWM11_6225, partial [Planctomycetaceae bacterium]|nr:hypothetical protein [Planctomycetaceae bacterium]
AGRHAKVVSVRSGELKASDAANYKADPPLTGDESRVVEVHDVKFPELLNPVDDLPPATIITQIWKSADGWHVRGVAEDNGGIREVNVNGSQAKSLRANFAEWEVVLPKDLTDGKITAIATDNANNVERVPHSVKGL